MKRNTLFGVLLFGIALCFIGFFNPEQYHFPRCPFLSLTGFKCPGCGSQRAMHHLLHGDVMGAIRMNLLFIPGIIYAGTGFILSVIDLKGWPDIQSKWYGRNAAWISLIVIVVFWISRNLLAA